MESSVCGIGHRVSHEKAVKTQSSRPNAFPAAADNGGCPDRDLSATYCSCKGMTGRAALSFETRDESIALSRHRHKSSL
ncbi:hypothetical protein [Caballeronia sp. M1242]|uniref:hypothetical protein n=1 Tax=Caballeronia sp. M1242 TaxID=2814653 RepID=UPI0019D03336|nr:hypothetical protein [Caballeronia sp. M1242]QSN64017.1 hypothetical protein JYK05_22130 [Caballeronia sp. M1242]